MLEEQSQLTSDYVDIPPAPSRSTTGSGQKMELSNLQAAIAQVFEIRNVVYPPMPRALAQFSGQLLVPAAEALDQLEPIFEKNGVHAYFTQDERSGSHLITVFQGRYKTTPRPWWPNALLFVLTVLSLLFLGASIEAAHDDRTSINLLEGWPYALSLILILGAHELGHYFAARYHNVSVTLPYFIPMPISFFGTLGAFIQLREPMRNRRVLFDVGVAGPLMGLFFAVPILFLGLATSEIKPDPAEGGFREGNSIVYALAKTLVFGRFVPSDGEDVLINQLAQAGWTGLFITGLNLVPLGQLDGGHVTYTLFGRFVRRLYWPLIAIFVALSLINTAWLIWTILLFMLGRSYAMPLDDITPLDGRRRLIGYVTLLIFILVFVPNPLTPIN